MNYWYNVESGQVQDDRNKSQGADLLGPYESPEAAENALATARERTEAWDAADREWNEGPSK